MATSDAQNTATNNELPYVVAVEKDLLLHILTHMRDRKLTIGEAHQLAEDFLGLLPMHDKEDLLKKLSDLGQKYTEAREIYAKYGAPYEEEKRQKLLEAMRTHIKSGNIEQAIAVAKGGKNG